MLSAGMPIDQKANEPRPPERKLASGVLIYGAPQLGCYIYIIIMDFASYDVPLNFENPRIKALG